MLSKVVKRFVGQPVAVLCARYWYRGVVSEVGDDFIILSNPKAVEVTGAATGQAPQSEDEIPSDLVIAMGAIEIVCQPTWAFHNL